MPCSSSVGTFGSSGERLRLVTPSAFTLPSLIWPITVGVLKKPIDTSPVITASTPCGAPL